MAESWKRGPRRDTMAEQERGQAMRRAPAAFARSNDVNDPHAERREHKARKRREFQADNRRSVRVLQRVMRRPKAKRAKR